MKYKLIALTVCISMFTGSAAFSQEGSADSSDNSTSGFDISNAPSAITASIKTELLTMSRMQNKQLFNWSGNYYHHLIFQKRLSQQMERSLPVQLKIQISVFPKNG